MLEGERLQLARDWQFIGYHGLEKNGCAQYSREITCGDRHVGRIISTMGFFELQMSSVTNFITISKHSSLEGAWNCFIMTYPGALLEQKAE